MNEQAIRRAIWRANHDCERGLRNLEAAIGKAPEYVISGDATGKRLIIPERAVLIGMHAYLAASIAAQREHDAK